MDKKNQKVVPTNELLKEMEELEILGGSGSDNIIVFGFSNCKPNYSGNCVAGCACVTKEDENIDVNPLPSQPDKP